MDVNNKSKCNSCVVYNGIYGNGVRKDVDGNRNCC